MKIVKQSASAVAVVAALLNNGGVVICPTDTVYGFLADAQNKKAVEKIYRIKKRPKSKPLPVFVSSLKMAQEISHIDVRTKKILKKYWPGPYTFIVKRKDIKYSIFLKAFKKMLYGVEKETIALRIPKHQFLQKLLKKVNRPLVQTSVNISSKDSLNNISDILATFGKSKLVGLIIDGGDIKKANPSKVMDLTKVVLTRLR